MIEILLDAVYLLGLVVISPKWLYRMIRHGRYRRDIRQRLGGGSARYGLQPTIWLHAVSLGEINAARALVAQLHSQLPDYRVVISSTTDTGTDAAYRHFAPDHMIIRWPLDFSFAVRRALDRIRPALVVLMEGDVWPNFLAACNERGVPVVVVNARISADKGYPRYKRLGRLTRRFLLEPLTAVGAQDEVYARRFRELGMDPARLHVTGMMKFETALVADRVDGQDELAMALGLAGDRRLIVAGGTGPGEENMMLDIWSALKADHADVRLAVVPRKPERFDEVARLIAAAGHDLVRRSEHGDGGPAAAEGDAVVLGDTMGELRKFYGLATCVFVGRSLVPMGGSDMIESAALGKATSFGPHTFNFPQADALTRHGCVRVADAAALRRQLDVWLKDPAAAADAGRRAQEYVRSQQGATKRNVAMICDVLGREPAVVDGAIATDKIPDGDHDA